MKNFLVMTAILIASFIGDGSGNYVFAQPVTTIVTKLFDAEHTVDTGPITSMELAVVRFSFPVITSFNAAAGDRAFLSSTRDGSEPIVADNFVTANGINVCPPGDPVPNNCFGDVIDLGLPIGVPIQDVLMPPENTDMATEVTAHIPDGLNAVTFDIRDFGGIAGNTEIYLIIETTDGFVIPPRPAVDLSEIRTMLENVEDQVVRARTTVNQIQKGQTEVVQQVRKTGTTVNQIQKGQTEVVQQVRKAGTTVNQIQKGQTEVVQQVRKAGTTVNQIQKGQTEVVQQVRKTGTTVNQIQKGQTEVVQQVRKTGTTVNQIQGTVRRIFEEVID